MGIGLGAGSTADLPARRIGARMDNEALTVYGVPTSEATAEPAWQVCVPTTPPESARRLDVAIDGTYEGDPEPYLPKGGGAMSRGKVVANAWERMVVVANTSKPVRYPGEFSLPVEIPPFRNRAARNLVARTRAGPGVPDGEVTPGMSGGSPFLTNGSHIPDIRLKRPDDPRRLGQEPNGLSDVIENRQFAGMCDMVIIGPCEGKIHVLGAGIRSEPNASRSDGRRGARMGPSLPRTCETSILRARGESRGKRGCGIHTAGGSRAIPDARSRTGVKHDVRL